MPKRNFTTLEEFKASLHKEGATLVEFDHKKIPCLLVDPETYDNFLKDSSSAAIGADTVLDIFYDEKDVFVDIQISLRKNNEQESFFEGNYLLYANSMIEFFESLSESGLMAIAPSTTDYSSKVFMIQLPKREAAQRALGMIKSHAKP